MIFFLFSLWWLIVFFFLHSYYAHEIQRIYRAHLIRKYVRKELVDRRYAALIEASRHYAAVIIQRYFKGYYSRQHLHDFYARKAYIQAIAQKGEQLRQELDVALAVQLSNQLAEEEAKARAEFDKTTQRLHHLVSTRTQPGVYNPPYAQHTDQVPSAFGIPLETHIRVGNLRFLRTNGLHPTGTSTLSKNSSEESGTLLPLSSSLSTHGGSNGPVLASTFTAMGENHVTLVPSYAHPTDKRSLQSMAPYDAPLEAARKEARIQKLLALDQKPFLAGTKNQSVQLQSSSSSTSPGVGVHAAVPFQESWLLARLTRDMEHIEGKDKRVTNRPYIPASSRSSRLFEDTERKRAGFADALVNGTNNSTNSRALNSTKLQDPLLHTNSTQRIDPTTKEHTIPALTATIAGIGGGANSIIHTTTIRQGNQTIKVRTAEENSSKIASTNSSSSLKASIHNRNSNGTSSTNAFPVGSAAAAVRKARQNTSILHHHPNNNNQDSSSDNEIQFSGGNISNEVIVSHPGFPSKPPRAVVPAALPQQQQRTQRPVMKPPVAISTKI